MNSEEKLDKIMQDLSLLKSHFKIVPDKDITIKDGKLSISEYELFAKAELKLNEKTITNQLSILSRFLYHSKGVINKSTVQRYLDSNDSESWKSNQIKALRKYIRDFLQLGNWINEFSFSNKSTNVKIKHIPTDEQIVSFFENLPYQVQIIFLILHDSGLRISEVMSLRFDDFDVDTNMINALNSHTGKTKHSWISYVTQQTSDIIESYFSSGDMKMDSDNPKLFSLSQRSVQKTFQNISEKTGISINPHMLRTVFSEKCSQAGMKDKYIDAFCGRIPKSVLQKHYTDYSPEALKREYQKVASVLTLNLDQ